MLQIAYPLVPRNGWQTHFARSNYQYVPRTFSACEPTSSIRNRFWMSSAIRASRYRTSFSNRKFFFDCVDIFCFRSRSAFCAVPDVINLQAQSRPPRTDLLPTHHQSRHPCLLQRPTCRRLWLTNACSDVLTGSHRESLSCLVLTWLQRDIQMTLIRWSSDSRERRPPWRDLSIHQRPSRQRSVEDVLLILSL